MSTNPPEWEYLCDANEATVREHLGAVQAGYFVGLPAPAVGRFVIAREPPTGNGEAEMCGEEHCLPRRKILALQWPDHAGQEVIYPTEGLLLMHGRTAATWLPDGWEIAVYPAGWTRLHIDRW